MHGYHLRELLSSSLLIIVLITGVFVGDACAIFWGNQEFDNLEKKALTGYTKDIVNNYFDKVKEYTVGDANLMKGAIFLALFLTIVKFGFGQGGIAEFGKYLFTAVLLLLPFVPSGNGYKSLPIFVADTSDRITEKIIEKIGAPKPRAAGSAVFILQGYNQAKTETLQNNKRNLRNFNDYCYSRAVKQYQENTKKFDKVPKPSDKDLDEYYKNIMVSFNKLPHKMQAEALITPGKYNRTCLEIKETIKSDLQDDLLTNIGKADSSLQVGRDEIPQNVKDQINNMKQMTSDELLDWAAKEVGGTESKERGKDLGEWGLSAINSIIVKPVLFGLGMMFLWFFDYYIFDVVAVVKTLAAMGLAFGVLYFMYFRDIKIPLTSLGLWAAANGLYIVAGVNMMIYYIMVEYDAGLFSSLGWLLGFDTVYGRALITLAFGGTASTLLAGVLSWAGFRGTIGFLTAAGGNIIPTKQLQGLFKSKSDGSNSGSITPTGGKPTGSTPPASPPPRA